MSIELELSNEYEEEALALLLEQFKNKDNLAAFISALMVPMQDAEAMLESLWLERWLDNAAGAQLDGLGTIVGVERGNLSDAEYLIRIKARIKINVSSGTPDEIVEVLQLVLGSDYTLDFVEYYPAAFIVTVLGAAVASEEAADELGSIVADMHDGGVHAALVYSLYDTDHTFKFASAYSAVETDASTGFKGITWTAHTAAEANQWRAVAYSPELGRHVAVSDSGTHRVMYSDDDGATWNTATAAEANSWFGVCWAASIGKFVAVAQTGTHRVMWSLDGINWNTATASAANSWTAICWAEELGTLVAVAVSGASSAMTSPDGINWTGHSTTSSILTCVCWSPRLSLFVAFVNASNTVLTSPTGATWTAHMLPESNNWTGVCEAADLGLLVAVAASGTHRVAYSINGSTWFSATAAEANQWGSVCWDEESGKLCSVSYDGTHQIMLSDDAINWFSYTATESNSWRAVCAAPNLFVAVAANGTTRVMTGQNSGGGHLAGVRMAS